MSLVLDCSVTLAWYFEDEVTETTEALLTQVTNEGALVPPLWRFEVANGLQVALKRKRIGSSFRDRALSELSAMPIEVDAESESHAWSASVDLSDRHGLTVYDAAYLELAQRRRLPLATLDAALIRAAASDSVRVLGS